MENIEIRGQTYVGMDTVSIPKADGSGDAEFILPEGEEEITENGEYDVTRKKTARVNVPASGTDDYIALSNKPAIGGVTLQGNKTPAQLGLVAAQEGAGLIPDTERQQIQENADDIADLQGEQQQQGTDLQQLQDDVDAIEEKIPNQASAQNQLADKDFVNSSINSAAAFFRGSFASRAALLAVAWQTSDPSAANYVSNNDYAYVQDDETHSDEAWRYIYVLQPGGSDNGWQPQFRVNESPLTAAQVAALNSGATAALIAQITANQTAIAGKIDAPNAPALGQFLKWTGTAWVAASLPVNPDAKTSDQTQPVGVDANGKLWTAPGGSTVIVDDELSDTSENPVQNKIITGEVRDLKSALSERVSRNGVAEVTAKNLQIMDVELSPNLFDESAIENNTYYGANGTKSDNTSYKASGFIPVEAGEKYCFSWRYAGSRTPASLRFFACYDENKNAIASAGSNTMITSYPITIAENVHFVRLSFSSNALYTQYQFEKGETPTEYHPYGEILSAKVKPEYIDVEMSSIPAFRLVEGQNILNRNDPDFANGKFLTTAGAISDNASYATSGFIPVQPGDRLIGSYKVNSGMGPVGLRTVAAYNAEKTAVSSLGKYAVQDFTVPNGIAYVRICYSTASYGENVQIQKVLPGESYYPFKEYEEPHYELKPDYMFPVPSAPEHVFLPTDIYVAVGRTIELYNEQIVLDHEKYHFQWVCGKGAAYKRKFSITGQTVGNLNLALYLYDDNMNLCWKGGSVIHVVAASNPVKKILPIGDSLTNWKAWLQETMLLSSNNISFVGTRYSGESRDSENNLYPSGTIHSEGRSGWAADAYLSNATYTYDNRYDGVSSVDGSANPFWDGEKFSLSHYLSVQTGVPTPDAVQIFLGTNDIRNGVDVAVSNISQMVNTIRSEYPDMLIFVCNTIYRSNQNGYGSVGSDAYAGGSGASSWQYDQDSKVMELALGLRNSLANVSGIYFIPLMSCMDREYDFGQVMTKVNPRSSVEIPMPEESVHPQAVGYYQMADLMYSFYCGVLS